MERERQRRIRSRTLRFSASALGALLLVGVAAPAAGAAVPDAPAAPTIVGGDTQIVVTYVAPVDNGATITKYTANCTSGVGTPGSGVFNSPDGSVSPITVTGLSNGANYTCNVVATNADGDGTPSAESAPALVAGVPDKPAAPTVSAGATSLTVTFTAPLSDNGSAITLYTASCASTDGGGPGSNTSATVTPITVSGLSNGHIYKCHVVAHNAAGDSAASDDSSPALTAVAPNAPAKPTIAAGNTQIVVSFTAPSDNGSAITRFDTSCTSTGSGTPGTGFVLGATATPITVTGLTNGQPYTCTVVAHNGVGDSPASVASDPATPATVPNAPAQPSAVRGNAQVVVTYAAPADNGSTITRYDATCTSSDLGATGTGFLLGAAATPITVTGLTNGKTYACNVAATNGAGAGPASPDSPAVVVGGVPDAPAQPTIAAGNTQIVVTFAAPANNGSAITRYDASCTSSGSGAPGTGFLLGATATPITVTGLTNGQPYTCKVTATNGIGTSSASPDSLAATPAAVPDAPAAPTILAGNAQIIVTFVAPANNGAAISGYNTTCSATGGATGTGSLSGATASPVTVSGLTNGQSYTCNVTATNSAGTSPASPDSLAAIPTGAPAQPAKPTVARGDGQMIVTFTAPSDGGSAITRFDATCTSSDLGATGTGFVLGATATPITVTGLTNGKTYTCNVTATNGVGASPASPDSVAIVVGIPNAPSQPTAAPGNTQIVVTFATPSDHGHAITRYDATCTSTDGGTPGTASFLGAVATPITVTGLTNGKTYTCTVSATNSVGSSPQSVPSAAVVPALLPDPPAQPIVSAGNGQIVVTFTAPSGNGNPITGYTATCASTDGGAPGSHPLSGPVPAPITVTGLTNGKTYTCTVTATNIIGTGPPSPPSVATVPATAPLAPTHIAAASGDAALQVSFTPRSNNGSAITSFLATCISGTGGAFSPISNSGASSPIVVTGVSNGYLYTCRVKATNALGSSADSVASNAVIVGIPGAPTNVSVVSGQAGTSTGALKVSFSPAPGNGGPVTGYTVTCTPVTSGQTQSNVGLASPIAVTGLLTGHAYSCIVFAQNFRGAGALSAPARGIVGTPNRPIVVGVMQLAHGLAFAFAPPSNNGSGITNYRAKCTSRNGGAPSSPLQISSPIVANQLTVGKKYTCLITAINGRGESPPTKIGPSVVANVHTASLASCIGHGGSLRAAPGLELSVNRPHSYVLAATFGTCTGPYVRKAHMRLTFRSKSGYSCKHAIGTPNAGSGTLTWTAPSGRGTSDAAVQFTFTATKGHTTTAHFHGVVTQRSNLFSDARINGTITMQQGLGAAISGGDCDAFTRLQKFIVTSVKMTVS